MIFFIGVGAVGEAAGESVGESRAAPGRAVPRSPSHDADHHLLPLQKKTHPRHFGLNEFFFILMTLL